MKRIFEIFLMPVKWWKDRQAYKKRLEELRKRDPFIYK